MALRTFFFNTGQRLDMTSYLGPGEIEINGYRAVPFKAEDVPDDTVLHLVTDQPNEFPGLIQREMYDTVLPYKYAYFKGKP